MQFFAMKKKLVNILDFEVKMEILDALSSAFFGRKYFEIRPLYITQAFFYIRLLFNFEGRSKVKQVYCFRDETPSDSIKSLLKVD